VLSFPAMSDGIIHNPTPQFGTAEYVGLPGNDHCQFCHQPITGAYYRVNESMACAGCAEQVRGELAKDTHAAYVRGLLFGIGAAVAGLILYATFAIATGIIIGYVSLAVGWMVGKAILKGSGGVGGRRYQITAALLTYAAVSMAAVPVWIHYAGQHKHAQRLQSTDEQKQRLAAEQRQLENEFGQHKPLPPTASTTMAPTLTPAQTPTPAKPRPSFVKGVALLAFIGLASPFIAIWSGGPSFGSIIGIVILTVGIRIAWRITAAAPLQVYGPFENSAQPAR